MNTLYDAVMEAITRFEESDELYSEERLKASIGCVDRVYSDLGFSGVDDDAETLLIHTANAVSLLRLATVFDMYGLYKVSCIKRELYEIWKEGDPTGHVRAYVPYDLLERLENPDAEYVAK